MRLLNQGRCPGMIPSRAVPLSLTAPSPLQDRVPPALEPAEAFLCWAKTVQKNLKEDSGLWIVAVPCSKPHCSNWRNGPNKETSGPESPSPRELRVRATATPNYSTPGPTAGAESLRGHQGRSSTRVPAQGWDPGEKHPCTGTTGTQSPGNPWNRREVTARDRRGQALAGEPGRDTAR